MPIYKKVNKNFFKKWTPEMAYVLGFFAADGNIIKTKRNTNFFSIQVTDKKIVYSIREVLGSEHLISKRKSKGSEKDLYRLQIGSKELCDDLRNLGFAENKSKRMLLPDIPKKYLSDFIRGYFDGDGNVWVGKIHKNRKTQSVIIQTGFTSGSKIFLVELQNTLTTTLGLTGSLIKRKNKDCWSLRYSINDSLKLYDFMYNTRVPKGLLLDRKKIVFERYINMQL